MNRLNELRTIVLESESAQELTLMELELTEMISGLYAKVSDSRSKAEANEHKANLSMANTLIRICREKGNGLRDKNNRLNYNFRMAAKDMLTPETFKKIMDKAHLPRLEAKAQREEMNQNRMAL